MSERLQTFFDAVTAEIRCQEVHADIRAELAEHILSLQEGYIESGLDSETALVQAIAQMGAPAEIGQRFDKVHRPRIEWGLVGLTLVLTLVGLWASLVGGGAEVASRLRLIGLGVLIGAPLFLVDYRGLRRWGWALFSVTGLLVAYALSPLIQWGFPPRDDLRYLFLVASPHLFAIGFTTIMSGWDWQRRWTTPLAFGLLLLPILLYSREFVSLPMIYIILWSVQFFASRPSRVARLWYGGLVAIGGALMTWQVLAKPYRLARLLAWLHLRSDPQGAGYHLIQSLTTLREAGLFGHGPFARLETLPASRTDFVFPYLVHTLGWVGGLAILLVIVGFGLRLIRATRQVREPFGASLMRLIGVILLLDGGWNLLMVVGLMPIMSSPLPFISGDGALVYQLALTGLALGIYRRKDLQPAPARTNPKPSARA